MLWDCHSQKKEKKKNLQPFYENFQFFSIDPDNIEAHWKLQSESYSSWSECFFK